MEKSAPKKPSATPRRKLTERHLERMLIQGLRYLGYLPLKTDAGEGSRYAGERRRSDIPPGFPDLTVLHPKHPAFFIELKREGKKPTSLQKQMHEVLRDQGYHVFVVVGEEEVETLLQSLRNLHAQ